MRSGLENLIAATSSNTSDRSCWTTPGRSMSRIRPKAGAFAGSAIGGIAMTKLGRRVLHAGLVVEAAGLLAVYAVLRGAAAGVSTVDLLAPMVVGGIGMGMVFVPLFDIVMAGVRPQEMGSASGVLQTVNALGMSLGIAGIGAIFFAGRLRPLAQAVCQ